MITLYLLVSVVHVSDVDAVGYWNIVVHGRKHSYRLYTKMLNEAMRWVSAIQGVIENKAPIETPTQQLIRDIKVKIYGVNHDMRDATHGSRFLVRVWMFFQGKFEQ